MRPITIRPTASPMRQVRAYIFGLPLDHPALTTVVTAPGSDVFHRPTCCLAPDMHVRGNLVWMLSVNRTHRPCAVCRPVVLPADYQMPGVFTPWFC